MWIAKLELINCDWNFAPPAKSTDHLDSLTADSAIIVSLDLIIIAVGLALASEKGIISNDRSITRFFYFFIVSMNAMFAFEAFTLVSALLITLTKEKFDFWPLGLIVATSLV